MICSKKMPLLFNFNIFSSKKVNLVSIFGLKIFSTFLTNQENINNNNINLYNNCIIKY